MGRVPCLRLIFAANHNKVAIASHQANFPDVEHYDGDIRRTDLTRFPYAAFFWASPACPDWTNAKGKKRTFDKANRVSIFGDEEVTEEEARAMRSRAPMDELPRYLRHWHDRGRPVLAGVVENVIEVRHWGNWKAWVGEFHEMGYETRVIAYNSMHADAPKSKRAPQSRDRVLLRLLAQDAGAQARLGQWLRPSAYCKSCDTNVKAMQVFKNPGQDMGRYGIQYVYRCPHSTCRNQIVEPDVMPALTAIDWSIPGIPIGQRKKPLVPATMARVQAGLDRIYGAELTLDIPTTGGVDELNLAMSPPIPMPVQRAARADGKLP
ncbi:DNA (cytosine-5)-methyltransferase 1 [Actinopolymorpha cephalotaxi]|uniref:DNA (Cytosine-5)-methyltransferase 1 n=1 Tax=Actinopolymorpha cephalotaxi TaxID=504797 RepID=A0A1I3A5C3_9ACTN|nr:DNA (cytosine-5)-methyltransferase 1 [Actinopolymorpha cephalotaxi]SFH44939.1 DNA (cytosine-5)-methyltransferase 1 [Actinopolymorpha cephalotaxi]